MTQTDTEPLGDVLAKALEASEAQPRVYAQPRVSSITIERKAAEMRRNRGRSPIMPPRAR